MGVSVCALLQGKMELLGVTSADRAEQLRVGTMTYNRVQSAFGTIARLSDDEKERNEAEALRLLAGHCANKLDYAADGPLYGGSNATLKEIWGIPNVTDRTITRRLKDLTEAGWIERYRLPGNSKRWWRHDPDSGLGFGQGYRLSGVLSRLQEIEARAAALIRIREEQRELHTLLIRAVERLRDRAKDLFTRLWRRLRTLKDTAVSYGRALAEVRAEIMAFDGVEQHQTIATTPCSTSKMSDQNDPNVAPLYEKDLRDSSGSSGALSEGRSRQGRPPLRSFPKASGPDGDLSKVAHLIGNDLSELFPAVGGLDDPTASMRSRCGNLSAMLRVDGNSLDQAARISGWPATFVMLCLTAQHQADGRIHSSARGYFAGIVKKLRKGDVNLAPSIYGRLAKAG